MLGASDLTRPVLKEIQEIKERTVAIAEDFPDDLYNTYRPKGNPDVRSRRNPATYRRAERVGCFPHTHQAAARRIDRLREEVGCEGHPDLCIQARHGDQDKGIVRRSTESNRRESRSEEAGVVDLCHRAQQRPLRKSGDLLPRKRARAAELTAIVGGGPISSETRNGMK